MNKKAMSLLLAGFAWAFSLDLASAADGLSPTAAFEKLKGLAGRWEGHAGTPDGPEGAVEYRVTAAQKLVMEVLFPGSDHEMITFYYLDGDELVGKHFCVMGNQPEMKLDADASSENELRFAFTGGSNMDPAKDVHMHGGKMSIREGRLESVWAVYKDGKEDGANRFFLTRAKN